MVGADYGLVVVLGPITVFLGVGDRLVGVGKGRELFFGRERRLFRRVVGDYLGGFARHDSRFLRGLVRVTRLGYYRLVRDGDRFAVGLRYLGADGGDNVDVPTGELSRESDILASATNSERLLVLGNGDPRAVPRLIEGDFHRLGGGERLSYVFARGPAPLPDVPAPP